MTGNFIGLENLEELNLSECENLEELDSSIGCLQKLVLLDLSDCARLKRLPWGSMGKLTSLQHLNLDRCPNLLEISHEVGSPISRKHLNLRNTIFNSLPNSLCQLHQLTELILSFCTKFKSIPDLPLSINVLYVAECINLVNLPTNICELQYLKELRLHNCFKLGSEGFTQVTGLRNLRDLTMKNCNVYQVSSRIGNLVSLRFLDLSGNTFKSLPEDFSNLSELNILFVNDCSELQLLPPLPSQLRNIEAINCCSLDVMPFDSMQNAYIFRSKPFKESLMSTKGLLITLSGKELPEWCTYGNTGNVLSFVAPIQFDHSKICGLVLCATRDDKDKDYIFRQLVYPAIYNKTKGTSHQFYNHVYGSFSLLVMFCPLNDTTLMVEAGDIVEVEFDDEGSFKSCGLRLVYENDVLDSGFVLKDVREPLFPTSEMSAGIIQLSCDDDVHVNDDGLITHEEMFTFPVQDDDDDYFLKILGSKLFNFLDLKL